MTSHLGKVEVWSVQNWTQHWRKQVWSFLFSSFLLFLSLFRAYETSCNSLLLWAYTCFSSPVRGQVCSCTMSEWTPSYSWLWSWTTLRMCAPVSQLHVSIMSASLLYMLSSKYSTWALSNPVSFKNSADCSVVIRPLCNLGFIPVRAILTHLSEGLHIS